MPPWTTLVTSSPPTTGRSWSSPKNVDPGNVLDGVSRPTTSFCVAVDDVGVTSSPTTAPRWSSPKNVDPHRQRPELCLPAPRRASVPRWIRTTLLPTRRRPPRRATPCSTTSITSLVKVIAHDFALVPMGSPFDSWRSKTDQEGRRARSRASPTGRAQMVTCPVARGSRLAGQPYKGGTDGLAPPIHQYCIPRPPAHSAWGLTFPISVSSFTGSIRSPWKSMFRSGLLLCRARR